MNDTTGTDFQKKTAEIGLGSPQFVISGAILFDICSFATMIDSTGAFSCIDLIKSHSSKKKTTPVTCVNVK